MVFNCLLIVFAKRIRAALTVCVFGLITPPLALSTALLAPWCANFVI